MNNCLHNTNYKPGVKDCLLIIATIFFQLIATQLYAGPVTNAVLDDYDIKTENGKQTIRIHFTVPVHYLSHFPVNSGTQLFIRIQPIPIGNLGRIISRRDALLIKESDDMPLSAVQYDGEFSFTPYLIIDFNKEVRYRVYQEHDVRSISIVINPE